MFNVRRANQGDFDFICNLTKSWISVYTVVDNDLVAQHVSGLFRKKNSVLFIGEINATPRLLFSLRKEGIFYEISGGQDGTSLGFDSFKAVVIYCRKLLIGKGVLYARIWKGNTRHKALIRKYKILGFSFVDVGDDFIAIDTIKNL